MSCQSPALAALAGPAETCVQRHRAAVGARCAALGLSDVDEALAALIEMRSASGMGGVEGL